MKIQNEIQSDINKIFGMILVIFWSDSRFTIKSNYPIS